MSFLLVDALHAYLAPKECLRISVGQKDTYGRLRKALYKVTKIFSRPEKIRFSVGGKSLVFTLKRSEDVVTRVGSIKVLFGDVKAKDRDTNLNAVGLCLKEKGCVMIFLNNIEVNMDEVIMPYLTEGVGPEFRMSFLEEDYGHNMERVAKAKRKIRKVYGLLNKEFDGKTRGDMFLALTKVAVIHELEHMIALLDNEEPREDLAELTSIVESGYPFYALFHFLGRSFNPIRPSDLDFNLFYETLGEALGCSYDSVKYDSWDDWYESTGFLDYSREDIISFTKSIHTKMHRVLRQNKYQTIVSPKEQLRLLIGIRKLWATI